VPRLILLLAIAAVVYILWRRIQALPPHKRRNGYIQLGLGVLVIIVLGLSLTGRMHWLGAALTGLLVAGRQLLPLALRFFPMLASLRSKAAAGSGQTSTVESTMLRMQLDHDSGELSGEVLKGRYAGWRLQDMERAQLEELMAHCASEDDDSVQLLDSYLQQRFPGEGPFQSNQPPPGSHSTGQMNRSEALAVLGLDDSATPEDIVTAHRKLMQRLHPDRGGNDYLAAKVNQAKDVLS
jgi:DnaJ-domain-containing protein 1